MTAFNDLLNNLPDAEEDSFGELLSSLPDIQEKTSFTEDVKSGLSRTAAALGNTYVNMAAKLQGYENAQTSIRSAVKRGKKKVDEGLGFDEKAYSQKNPGFGGKLTTGGTMLAPILAAGIMGNFPLAAGLSTPLIYGRGKEMEYSLLDQGVDQDTADKVKQIEWLSSGLDYLIPTFGKAANVGQLVAKSTIQGASNVGQNFLTDLVQQKTLEGKGYTRQAKAFNPYDWEQRAAEFVLGAGPSAGIRYYDMTTSNKGAKSARDKLAKLDANKGKLSLEVNGTNTSNKPTVMIPSEWLYRESSRIAKGNPIPENLTRGYVEVAADSPIAKQYNEHLNKQQESINARVSKEQEGPDGQKIPARPDLVNQMELDLQPPREQPPADPRDPNAFHFPKRDEQLDLFTPDNITRTVDQQSASLEDAGILRTRDTMNERTAEADAQASGMFRGREDMDIPPPLDPTRPALTQAPTREVASPQTVADAALLRSQGGPMPPRPEGTDLTGRTATDRAGTPEQRPALLGPISSRTKRGRQRGAVINPKEAFEDFVTGIKGQSRTRQATPQEISQRAVLFKTNAPELFPIEDVNTAKTMAQTAPDIDTTRLGKWLGAGPRHVAMMTNNPLIKWLNNAMNRADDLKRNWIQKHVMPFAEVWSKMTPEERVEANAALTYADANQRYLTPEELRNAGFNDNVITFIQKYWEADKAKLAAENVARTKAGLPLIEERPGHVPGRWRGDFTQLVYRQGENGPEIVAVLQTNSLAEARRARIDTAKRLKGERLEFSKLNKRPAGGFNRSAGDLASGMQEILRILGNDPRFDKVRAALEAMGNKDAMSMYGADKHALFKKGVLGNEGNKPWKSAAYNADERFFSLVSYFEEGATSLSRRDIYKEIRGLIGDPDLQKKQAKALAYMQDYYNQQNDINQHPVGKFASYLFEAAPTLVGFGPSTAHRVANRITNFYQTVALSSLRFMLMQLLQPYQTGTPMLARFANAGDLPFANVLNHERRSFQDLWMAQYEHMFQKKFPVDAFTREMYDYAQQRGITAFSGLDRAVEAGKSPVRKKAELAAVFPQEFGERATRPQIFFALARSAQEMGLSTKDALNAAYEATQLAMVDYRDTQAPMIYQKLGAAGDHAIRLRKFSHGLGSQIAYYGKHDKAALMTLAMNTFILAGISGMVPLGMMAAMYKELTGEDLEEKMLENLYDWVEYGVLSAGSGQWLQPTFSLGGLFPDLDNPVSNAFPYMGMAGKTAQDATTFVKDPSYDTLASLLLSMTPAQFRNLMQKQMFKDEQGNLLDRKREFVSYRRKPEDWETLGFTLGLTSFEEGKNKAKKWANTTNVIKESKDIQALKDEIKTMLRRQQFTKDELNARIVELAEKDPESVEGVLKSIETEVLKRHFTRDEFELFRRNSLRAAKNYREINKGINRE